LLSLDNDHPIRFAVILNPTIINELEKLTNQSLEKPFIMFHQLNSVSQVRDFVSQSEITLISSDLSKSYK